jgi:hypothetical protein
MYVVRYVGMSYLPNLTYVPKYINMSYLFSSLACLILPKYLNKSVKSTNIVTYANNCFYAVAIQLHELHMYMVSHMVSCICCNSCNLFKTFIPPMQYVELAPNGKANCKSPHFFIVTWYHIEKGSPLKIWEKTID